MIHLAIFWMLAGGFLRSAYRGTKLFGLGYVARLFGAGFVLEVVLAYEIQLTSLGLGEEITISDTANRIQWIMASTSWLLACGICSSFAFGFKPAEPSVKKYFL